MVCVRHSASKTENRGAGAGGEAPERMAEFVLCITIARRAAQAPPTNTASGQQKQPATLVTRQRRHVSVTPQVRRLSLVFRGAVSRRVLEPILTRKNP